MLKELNKLVELSERSESEDSSRMGVRALKKFVRVMEYPIRRWIEIDLGATLHSRDVIGDTGELNVVWGVFFDNDRLINIYKSMDSDTEKKFWKISSISLNKYVSDKGLDTTFGSKRSI